MAIRKIIQRSTDNLFVNTEIGGTEAFKAPVGTTAQRESSPKAGDQRFNTTISLMEYYDGAQWKAIDAPPVISSVDTTEIDSQSGSTSTIIISGSNFQSGVTVLLEGSSSTNITPNTVTVDSITQITITVTDSDFNNTNEPYNVKVTNPSGLSSTLADQINVDSAPIWTTTAGQIGGDNIYEGLSASTTVAASDSDGDTIVYSVQSGTLPSGLTINSSSGVISGTPSSISGDTTSNFTLRATANTKTTDRAFNIIVKDSSVTSHASSNWHRASDSGNRTEGSGRFLTSSTSGSSGYLYSVSSDNTGSSGANAWLTSTNNPTGDGNFWRGEGTGTDNKLDSLELWFAGNEVTITNLVIYSYPQDNYQYNTVKIDYWNGSDWIKVAGLGGYSGTSSGWSWAKSGSNNRVNTITYTGGSASSFKSTNWRIFYGPNVLDGGDDVVHQNGCGYLNFSVLG